MLVENSSMQRKIIRKMIEDTGQFSELEIEIVEANLLAEALLHITTQKPDLILLALMLEDSTGVDTVIKVRNHTPEIPIVVLTGTDGEEIGMKAIQEGAQDYLVKQDVNKNVLRRTIVYALERGRLLNKVKRHESRLELLATKLSKYLSPQVYDTIFTGKREVRLETTRKTLSVFFSDIVGFAQRAEEMGQEELSKWLNSYLNEMANIALKYGGTLDKFIGDAVMVFFGDPETSGVKQDAVKCVQMGKDMQQRAKSLGVNIRTGIHTGSCTVGNFGSEERMEYTIIGQTVNLASRLESNAEPGRILISSSTYELVKDIIVCELHGEIKVKGIDRAIITYWVN